MIVVLNIASVVSAFATAAVAIIAGLAWYQNQKLVEANRQLVAATRDQLRSQQRPIVVPNGPLLLNGSESEVYDAGANLFVVKVKNLGSGVALDVRLSLLPPGADPARPTFVDPRWHSALVNMPIAANETCELSIKQGGLLVVGTDTIGGETLCPPYPLYFQQQELLHSEARLTLTYADVYGTKHMSMFDRKADHSWESVYQVR